VSTTLFSTAIFPIIHAHCCVLTADVLYDLGTALEVVSPLCPQLFLEVAGLGNFAKVAFLTGIAPFRLQNIDIYNLLFDILHAQLCLNIYE
jgi:hypothetical protein